MFWQAQKAAVSDGYAIWEISYLANTLEALGLPEEQALQLAVEVADALAAGADDPQLHPVIHGNKNQTSKALWISTGKVRQCLRWRSC